MPIQTIETPTLEIAYLARRVQSNRTALLLHGWPDDATTWAEITPGLNAAGISTFAPWLRGFGETRFLSSGTYRDGRAEALAQDALDLMDALGVDRFSVIGHDWGARTAYALAALAPERIDTVTALSLGYTPRGNFPVPSFEQSRAWWYQWFLSVDRGCQSFVESPKAFARLQWDTWSPAGWFDDALFDEVAHSFENPDFVAITCNSYRSRWRNEPHDRRYDTLHDKIAAVETLSTPTLMIQGAADGTVLPASTEGKEKLFTGEYHRVLLEGVGHFPTREAPGRVTKALIDHLA
jgi:pimeloyl-ACP methyl ester carboxylesterase